MAVTSRAVPSMTARTDNDSTGGGDRPVPADDEFLTVGDVAERLRVHPQTVRAWIARGDLRAIRIGRTVRIRQTDFQEMLERAPDPAANAFGEPCIRAIAHAWRGSGPAPARYRRACRAARGERSVDEANTASPARQAARRQAVAAQDAAATNELDGGLRRPACRRSRALLHRLRCQIGGSIRRTWCPSRWAGAGTPVLRHGPVPRRCHRRYDRGELDLLPYLEPA